MCVTTTSPATTVNPTAAQFIDERTLLALPKHFLAALPLTADEKQNSAVFILGSEHHDETTPEAKCVSRLAVCRLIPATEWEKLAEGAVIIYTERFFFSKEDFSEGENGRTDIAYLNSRAGVVRLNDSKRQVLYTAVWAGNQNDHLDHDYSEVHEIWQVQRFISLPNAK